MAERVRVALVFGGETAEHGVSCLTAASVMKAIDTERYEVIGLGITTDGHLTRYRTDEIAALSTVDRELPQVSPDRPTAVLMRTDDGCEVATLSGDSLVDRSTIDVAFTLMHGPFGEDGTIQGLLEIFGVRYVGSGVTSSAVGMDKIVMKQVLAAHGVPIGPYVGITPRQWALDREAALARVRELPLPVFVKPARGGSSMGISRVTDHADLVAAVAHAQEFDPKVVVEAGFVDAREIECAVLGDSHHGEIRTTEVGEIRMLTADRFYDFDAKYLPTDEVSLIVPSQVPDDVLDRARAMAQLAFEAIDGEGLARVDFFLTPEGELFVNEVNTMPGFTQYSMYPTLWQAAGVEYSDLITELLELALRRPLGLR